MFVKAPGIVEKPKQKQPAAASKPLASLWRSNVIEEDRPNYLSLSRIFRSQIFGQESKRLGPLAGDLMRRK